MRRQLECAVDLPAQAADIEEGQETDRTKLQLTAQIAEDGEVGGRIRVVLPDRLLGGGESPVEQGETDLPVGLARRRVAERKRLVRA